MSKKDSFVFYRSFFEALNDLPDENQLELYKAISDFSLNFRESKLSGISKTIFTLICPQLEANKIKYENGCKGGKFGHLGGRPKKEKTPKKPQPNPNLTPNDNVNDNVNDNYNEKEIKKINNKKNFGEEEKEKINIAFAECLQVIEIAKKFDEYSPAYLFENKITNTVVLGMGGIKELSKTIADKSDLSYWKHDFEKTWKTYQRVGKTSNKASGNLKKKSGRYKLIREGDPAYGTEEILIDNKIEIIPEIKI